MSNTDSDYPWGNVDGTIKTVDINNIKCTNGVLRNTDDSSSSIIRLLQII